MPYLTAQNGTQYEVWLCRDDGTWLQSLDDLVSFSYTWELHTAGPWRVDLPPGFNRNLIANDRKVSFYRKPVGGALRLDYQGLINYIPTEDDANSNTLVSIQGEHINTLLKRRTVAYPEGHAQADKTGYADDLMKAYVSYNLGANATTGNGREANGNLSSTYFGVQANTSLGPSTSMNASQMVLMTALQKLSAQARQAGTEVYWDIQSVNDAYCEFRTATGQMGMPRTADLANGLTFGKEFGNLQRPRLVLDARKEANRVYGLGRGQQSAIDVQTADDTERQGASIFALKEKAIRASVDSAGCLAAAQAALVEARPMYVFSGELTDNADSVYGLNWYRGDTVTVTYAGLQFSAHVRKIAIALSSDRRETTLAAVEAYL